MTQPVLLKRFKGQCMMLLLLLLTSFAASAQEAYTVFTETDSTLTFYYDELRSTRPGTPYDLNTGNHDPDWRRKSPIITQVVFDPSFAAARPTTTHSWFNQMNRLVSITGINYLKTDSVTDMGLMFQGCESLTTLDVSGFNTSSVTNMQNMFRSCKSLERIDLSSFNTEKVRDMYGMFAYCESLTSLDLSHFDTRSVRRMERMLYFSNHLETIYAGNDWSTDSLSGSTSSNHMFMGCTSLVGGQGTVYDTKYVDATYAHIDGGPSYPGYLSAKGLSADAVAYAVLSTDETTLTFYCDELSSNRSGTSYPLNTGDENPDWHEKIGKISRVVFNPSFATVRPTSTHSWFCGMSDLVSITGIQYLNTSLVTNMEKMFYDCELLTNLDVSGFNTSKVTNMESMFWYCSSVTSLDVSGFNTDNVTKMYRMFTGCQSLTSLDVGNFNTGNVISMESMFCDCESLVSLDLSGFNTSNVKNMERMFWDCSSLTSLDLSGFNTQNVTNMEDMFCDCASLTSLDVSSFNTSKVTNMFGLFNGCKSLTSLDLRGFNTSSVTEMYRMFADCSSLTAIDLSSFNTENLTSTTAMFDGCISLTSLDLSSFNTSKVQFMGTMFNGCDHLETIYAGKAWTTDAVTYSNKMFYGCINLVGGQGTTYNEHFVDAARAHIDGGPSNPGYFTEKVNVLHGDVNGDGTVNIADVNCIISVILGGPDFHQGRADVNADGSVTITDINAVIACILTGSGM